jgi:hypothetical protein
MRKAMEDQLRFATRLGNDYDLSAFLAQGARVSKPRILPCVTLLPFYS